MLGLTACGQKTGTLIFDVDGIFQSALFIDATPPVVQLRVRARIGLDVFFEQTFKPGGSEYDDGVVELQIPAGPVVVEAIGEADGPPDTSEPVINEGDPGDCPLLTLGASGAATHPVYYGESLVELRPGGEGEANLQMLPAGSIEAQANIRDGLVREPARLRFKPSSSSGGKVYTTELVDGFLARVLPEDEYDARVETYNSDKDEWTELFRLKTPPDIQQGALTRICGNFL